METKNMITPEIIERLEILENRELTPIVEEYDDSELKQQIKQLFNHVYICSDSYSKNPFFINYSLETYDDVHNKITNKLNKN